MGGSLGLALKKNRPGINVAGYARRGETLREALRMGAIDEAFDSPAEAVRDADIVVFCVPVLSIPVLARLCRGYFKKDAIVTDVGSVKACLSGKMSSICKPAIFIGSHPIAGSERAGIEAATADLYVGSITIVAPAPGTDRNTARELSAFWKTVGSQPVDMTPAVHDRIIARTSHLPHLVSALLAAHAGKAAGTSVRHLCGTGFRDVSRLAEGSPEMWRDIIVSNRQNIIRELAAFQSETEKLLATIRRADTGRANAFLEQARSARRKLVLEK